MSERFRVGDVIHHRRYGYRGVIVERDPGCQAEDGWYQNNQTQPARNQPWYHVLVHDGVHTTYVSERNLRPDPSGDPIVHPATDEFFGAFADGRYSPRRTMN